MTDFNELIAEFEAALQRKDVDKMDECIDKMVDHRQYKNKFKRTKRVYKVRCQYYAYGLGEPCPDLSLSKEELKYHMRGLYSVWLRKLMIVERNQQLKKYADNVELYQLLQQYYHNELKFIEFCVRDSRRWHLEDRYALYKQGDFLCEKIYHLVLKKHLKPIYAIVGGAYICNECTHPLVHLMSFHILRKFNIKTPPDEPPIKTKDFYSD